jgi:hypothetical protein
MWFVLGAVGAVLLFAAAFDLKARRRRKRVGSGEYYDHRYQPQPAPVSDIPTDIPNYGGSG